MEKNDKSVSLPTLKRLPKYYSIACQALDKGRKYISSKDIAKKLDINDSQVRKDFAAIKHYGRGKLGFELVELKKYLEEFLGFNEQKDAFLIGAGNLGIALAKYDNFERYGLNILALFDNNPQKEGISVGGKQIFHISKFPNLAYRMNVSLAILTVPEHSAQKVADFIVMSGIKYIWNFTSVTLNVPDDVEVWNEDLAASFATFSRFMSSKNPSINKFPAEKVLCNI